MSDLISRQSVLNILLYFDEPRQLEMIKMLPSAQPEIIFCQYCKHFVRDDIEVHEPYGFYSTYFHAFCDKHYDKEQGEYIDVCVDDFCSFGEKIDVME